MLQKEQLKPDPCPLNYIYAQEGHFNFSVSYFYHVPLLKMFKAADIRGGKKVEQDLLVALQAPGRKSFRV